MEELDLRDYISVIMARKWVIIGITAAVTVVALAVSLVQTPVYEGIASVLVSEKGSSSDLVGGTSLDISSQPERGLQTQVRIMKSRQFMENTIAALELDMTPEELTDRVTVTAVGQTNIVEFSAHDGDPEIAAAIANTLADQFVAWSREYQREAIRAAAAEVEKRLDAARKEVLDLGAQTGAVAEIAIANSNYTTLAAKLEELRINENLETGSGRVINLAVAADEPISPRPLRNTALGLMVGLVFGLGVAFLYEYMDNSIKSSDEVEKLLGVPVLGLVPAEDYKSDDRRRTAILTHPGSASAEAYRALRNNLDFVNFQHDLKTLIITSAAPSEGKSTVSANLAAGLAEAGRRVVLVASDFRKPTTTQFFGVRNLIGLSDVLTGSRPLKTALQRPREDLELLILTSGKLPPNPSVLLGSERMREVLEELKEIADWVIIDTPPVLAVADASAAARLADGVLFVTKGGESTREAVQRAGEMIQTAGGRLVGSVVWGLDAVGRRGGYAYGSYHSYTDEYNKAVETDAKASRGRRTASDGVSEPPRPKPRRNVAETTNRRRVMLAIGAVLAVAATVLYVLTQTLA
ncbi:MAG: tyrosine-protein kinase domain-containing protein [Coriobacteriia bacterium]